MTPDIPTPTETLPFQVDLRGVVDLLSRHIYSSPAVFVRELLQNGRDAIAARREAEALGTAQPASGDYGIHVFPSVDGGAFVLRDDGVGLTADEVTELLATVGRSSKRDILDLPRSDYLGQFGIGLLSCFMVSDDIVIRSRSARGGDAVEWIGSTDGTFRVRTLDPAESAALPVGTEVRLAPAHDAAELLAPASIARLIELYGRYLDVPIVLETPSGGSVPLTVPPAFLQRGHERTPELMALGRELCGGEPFDVIDLDIPGTQTRGKAFVLPYAPPPGSRQANRVYLGRMLLSEHVDGLLPDWAFFVRCVVDTKGLRPTASRESLAEDDALDETRTEIGSIVRRWIVELAATAPARLEAFVATHELALKALVVHDDELAPFIVKWLSVNTSAGRMSFGELIESATELRFTETVDEFRQVAGIVSVDRPVVNGGYVYDAEIVRALPRLFPGVSVERVTVSAELDSLESPSLAERAAATALAERARAVLEPLGCEPTVRVFRPADQPALYVADAEVLRAIERDKSRRVSSGPWKDIVGKLGEHLGANAAPEGEDTTGPRARLCLNWASPLVRTLVGIDDDVVAERAIQLIYVQALLAGHVPLQVRERRLLTTGLTDLIQLSLTSA